MMPPLLLRGLWYAALASLALLATVAAFDQQSLRDAEFAGRVPGPLRSFAQERIAVDALRSDDPVRALAETKKLVRRRPVPAEHLYLLAVAESAAGNPEAASRATQLSAERGWRTPQVQAILIDAALRAGMPQVAAARLLALWSVDADVEIRSVATQQVFDAPGGAEAFGAVLAQSRFSQTAVLHEALRYTTLANFMRMVEAAQAKGAVFDCTQLRQLSTRLEKAGQTGDAARVRATGCGQQSETHQN